MITFFNDFSLDLQNFQRYNRNTSQNSGRYGLSYKVVVLILTIYSYFYSYFFLDIYSSLLILKNNIHDK